MKKIKLHWAAETASTRRLLFLVQIEIQAFKLIQLVLEWSERHIGLGSRAASRCCAYIIVRRWACSRWRQGLTGKEVVWRRFALTKRRYHACGRCIARLLLIHHRFHGYRVRVVLLGSFTVRRQIVQAYINFALPDAVWIRGWVVRSWTGRLKFKSITRFIYLKSLEILSTSRVLAYVHGLLLGRLRLTAIHVTKQVK